MKRMPFVDALRQARNWIGTIDGVEEIAEGISDGGLCVTVFASSPDVRHRLPDEIGGWPVEVEDAASSGFSFSEVE